MALRLLRRPYCDLFTISPYITVNCTLPWLPEAFSVNAVIRADLNMLVVDGGMNMLSVIRRLSIDSRRVDAGPIGSVMTSDCTTFPFALLTLSSMPERVTGANGGVWFGIESVSEFGTGVTSLMDLPVSGMFKRSAGLGVGAAPEWNGTANNAAAKKAENAKRILDILPSLAESRCRRNVRRPAKVP